jgi:hypothetical protein
MGCRLFECVKKIVECVCVVRTVGQRESMMGAKNRISRVDKNRGGWGPMRYSHMWLSVPNF